MPLYVIAFAFRIILTQVGGQWDAMMQQAQANADVLGSQDNVKLLANVLKTNVAACTSIGTFFVPQISRIFLDMLQLYQAVSSTISMAVANEGTIELYGVCSILMVRTHRHGSPQDP
jgi:CRM1 C terminal